MIELKKNDVGGCMSKCEHCESKETKHVLSISKDNSLYLCSDCYNELMAEELGIDVEPMIDSFSLKDYQGTSRTFYVEKKLDPIGIFLEANENKEYGYRFAVHGELNCDQQELLNKLIAKARRGTRKQYVKEGVFPSGQRYNTLATDQIIGLLECDKASDRIPLVIIDGKPFTWDQLGKMLMSYEGFQIKIEMFDETDDVE